MSNSLILGQKHSSLGNSSTKRLGLTSISAAILAISMTIAPAEAVTITFDEQTLPQNITTGAGVLFKTQGFDLQLGSGNTGVINEGTPGICEPLCPHNGTDYLHIIDDGGVTFPAIRLAESNGFLFDLISVDLAEAFKGAEVKAARIDLVGFRVNASTVATSFFLDDVFDGIGGVSDFETFLLPTNFTDLVAVELNGTGGLSDGPVIFHNFFSLDNVQISVGSPPPPTIPEPTTITLLTVSLLSSAAFRRRNRQRIQHH